MRLVADVNSRCVGEALVCRVWSFARAIGREGDALPYLTTRKSAHEMVSL
jgi:hypothetical protein